MCEIVESTVAVPASLVRECCGLSVDFGSTLCKIIYRSKENLEEAKSKTKSNDLSHLQLVHIVVSKFELGLEHAKRYAVLNDQDGPLIVKTTGQGCSVFGAAIESKFSIKLKQTSEFDCFIKAFNYMVQSLDRANFLEAFDVGCIDDVIAATCAQMQAMSSIISKNETGDYIDKEDMDQLLAAMQLDPKGFLMSVSGIKVDSKPCEQPLSASESVYPTVLCMCGSGFGFMKIEESKAFSTIEMSNRGGRALLGLACLLVSCASYEEFMELASEGDASKLDFSAFDFYAGMQQTADDDTMYTVKMEESNNLLLFCFGKVLPGKKLDDFERKDVARALLNYYILDIVQTTNLTCHANNTYRVFLTGNVFNHPLVRLIFTKEMARKNILNFFLSGGKKKPVEFDFVKSGGYLGAIGALI